MLKKLAVAAISAAALAMLAIPAQAASCSRSALKGMIGDYFKAVETHSMSALPTVADLRVTENGKVVEPGEGFVKTGSGPILLQRDLIDTQRCGTVSETVMSENINGKEMPVIMAVRLKVDHGKVSQIETIITDPSEKGFYNPKGLLATKDQDWTTPLPKNDRRSRYYMNEAGNQYFSDFVKDPKVLPPFAKPCNRWEGGTHTTRTGNCSPKGLVLTHTYRRFPVTDREMGETAVFVNFAKGLPDVHIFKFNDKGQVYLINAVFGGRVSGPIWPATKETAMK